MKVEAEMVVPLVPVARRLSVASDGRAYQAANSLARNRVAVNVSARYGIDKPIVAAIGSGHIADHPGKSGFRFPIRSHVDPEFVAVGIEEVHDRGHRKVWPTDIKSIV